jgi:hypothetical protein
MPNHQILGIEDGGKSIGHLLCGQVDLGLVGPFQPAHLDVADHADDGPRSIAVTERPADGILPRPVAGCLVLRAP